MKQTYPAKRVEQTSTPKGVNCSTCKPTQHTQQLNIVLTCLPSQPERVGVQNCNGGHDSGGYNHNIHYGRLYSLIFKKTLERVSTLHLLDAFYNCPLPGWVWNVLLHIPTSAKKIDSFGGVL